MPNLKLKRDWVGRYVLLLYQMETNGGAIFEQGEIMHVTSIYRGLNLDAVRICPHCRRRYRHQIARVPYNAVVLLPLDYTPPEGDPPVEHLKEEAAA